MNHGDMDRSATQELVAVSDCSTEHVSEDAEGSLGLLSTT